MNATRRALIFSTVWPEPKSSAAGVRQMQWVNFLIGQGYEVILSSPAALKAEQDWGYLELPMGATTLPLPLNQSQIDGKQMGLLLQELNPQIVIFDRFILEEQFGHWIYQYCPNALVLLETQDLHFVRRARESLREKFLSVVTGPNLYLEPTQEGATGKTPTALREVASILRVDHAIVVSSFEEKLLTEQFEVPPSKISWIPMSTTLGSNPAESRKFEDRAGFCWVGNFRHAPNVDGLRWFRGEIWPRIRIRFPSAQIKVYGAYPSQEVMQWHRPQDGFHVLGHAENLADVFASARVNVAPLRFGAGVKGKILEAIASHLPTITTKVGVEGILATNESVHDFFPGLEANTNQLFAEACIAIHEDQTLWAKMSKRAASLAPRFAAGASDLKMKKVIERSPQSSVTAQVMRQELMNSHKYFARWIEAKNKVPSGSLDQPRG